MARGIDTAAHHGALRVNGSTIAVLGCGIEIVYPSENRKLAEIIAARGLLLSEFPMGAVAFPQNFPIRNRIISGISSGVMIVEAAQYSGSLITARLALDQGREVFAVPGTIMSKQSWGANLLIKQGATLVQDWKDVIDALPTPVRRMIFEAQQDQLCLQEVNAPAATSGAAGASQITVAPTQRRVLDLIQPDASIHIDALIEQLAENSSSEIIAALCELELAGQIRQLPGRNYVKMW